MPAEPKDEAISTSPWMLSPEAAVANAAMPVSAVITRPTRTRLFCDRLGAIGSTRLRVAIAEIASSVVSTVERIADTSAPMTIT